MDEHPLTERFHAILVTVQTSIESNHCKHGEGLYECLEDCAECFEEALEKFLIANEP